MEQVGIVPACDLSATFERAFGVETVCLDKIERPAAQSGEIFGSVASSGAALIFIEDHVKHPVELIFHAPMSTHGVLDALGIQRQAAQVIAPLGAGRAVDFPHRFDHGDAAQVLPSSAVFKPADVFALPATTYFQPPVALVDFFKSG